MTHFVEVMEIIGSIVGVILTLITFFGVITKKPKEWFKQMIRDESTAANQPVIEKLDKLEQRMDNSDTTDLVVIRDRITHIYMKYCEKKQIPHYEKENLISLYERYQQLHGNHYIKMIVGEMKDWEETI